MEPNISIDEATPPTIPQNRSPSAEETPGRMRTLSKSLISTQSSLNRALGDPSIDERDDGIEWGSGRSSDDDDRASPSERPVAGGGDGLSDATSATTDESSGSPRPNDPPPAGAAGVGRAPGATLVVDIDLYQTEEQIIARMKVLRKRYSESLLHVRRLRRSLGSLSPTPDDFERRMESGWDDENGTLSARSRPSRGSDDMDEDVFSEPTRQRAKATKRPEVVAQEKGITTSSLFSTKPSTDEIKIDDNGYKSYHCLLCGRTFTHPPAFSQHKRAHGREAGK